MTEAEFTYPIVTYLRDNGCITFKHCDRFTTSVPDVTATALGNTTWLEMKVLKKGETALARVMEDQLQFFHMNGLSVAGRASYVIRDLDKRIWLYPPSHFINLKMAIPTTKDAVCLGIDIHTPEALLLLNRGGYPAYTTGNNYQPILALVRAR